MIRSCTVDDLPVVEAIINAAATKYRGVIPNDCWSEPYMSRAQLLHEVSSGVRFWTWEEAGEIVGVMGLQDVLDVTLIRHAYVRPSHQGRGVGGALLHHLTQSTTRPILIGTWADASWAIRFYEDHGFKVAGKEETDVLLRTYWTIPDRQRESSVVLMRRPAEYHR